MLSGELNQINPEDVDMLDVSWQMAMAVFRAKKFMAKTGKNVWKDQDKIRMGFDKSKLRCFICDEYGHFSRECTKPKREKPEEKKARDGKGKAETKALVMQECGEYQWVSQIEELNLSHAMIAKMEDDAEEEHAFVVTEEKSGDKEENLIKDKEAFAAEVDKSKKSVLYDNAKLEIAELRKHVDELKHKNNEMQVKLDVNQMRNKRILQAGKALSSCITDVQCGKDKGGIGISSSEKSKNSVPPHVIGMIYEEDQVDRSESGMHEAGPPIDSVLVGVKPMTEEELENEKHMTYGLGNQTKTVIFTCEPGPSQEPLNDNVSSSDVFVSCADEVRIKDVSGEDVECLRVKECHESSSLISDLPKDDVLASVFELNASKSKQLVLSMSSKHVSNSNEVVNDFKIRVPNTKAGRESKPKEFVPYPQGQPRRIVNNLWYVDSGCPRHMTGGLSLLEEVQDFNGGGVSFSGGVGGKISKKGVVKNGSLTFFDVHYVEELSHSLLSDSQICDQEYSVLFNSKECIILKPGVKIPEECFLIRTPRRGNSYLLNMGNPPSSDVACLISKHNENLALLWHRRLGHANMKNLTKLAKGEHVRNLPIKYFSSFEKCVACAKGKQHKLPHRSKMTNTISSILQLLHMDLFGPMQVQSISRFSYCLVIVDDFSRFTWVFFLLNKHETPTLVKQFVTLIENQMNKKVKAIRSDNGTEFKNAELNMFCGEKGIERQYSAPYTPQQNGVVKRRNRTLIEAARTMLCEARLPIFFWAEVVNTACYVQNRVLLNKWHEKTPYEIIYGEKPKVGYFKSIGCPCTVLIQSDVGKFEAKADECYFVGYSANSSYRVYNKTTKVIIEAFNVDWLEDNPTDAGNGPDWIYDYGSLFEGFNFSNMFHSFGEEEDIIAPTPQERPPVEKVSDNVSAAAPKNDNADVPESSGTHDDQKETETQGMNDNINDTNLPVSVSVPDVQATRINRDSPLSNVLGPVSAGVTTRSRMGDINFCMFSCFISQIEPPNVMPLVKRPENKKVIPTRWLYKNKKDDTGVIVRNKARLIVQVHRQVHGIGYDEVYVPVARLEAIRIFLAVETYLNFTVHQMDVKTTFLYAEMNEEVYVAQPPRFVDEEHPDHVYLLDRALYGLYQAPRTWYETLLKRLVENGYTRGMVDKTLFRKRVKNDIIMVQVYVDDIIYGSTNEELCTEFEDIMRKKFEMSDQGEMSFFLALQVKQDESGILIHQAKYVNEILEKYKMQDSKSISTQMASRPLLTADADGESVVWIQNQLIDCGMEFLNTPIFCDNAAALQIVKNPVQHSKTKHIDIKVRFIRDCYDRQLIQLEKVNSDQNVSDLFTKPLPRQNFEMTHVLVDEELVREFWGTSRANADKTRITTTIQSRRIEILEEDFRRGLNINDRAKDRMEYSKTEVLEGARLLGYEGKFPPIFKKLLPHYWRCLAHYLQKSFLGKRTSFDQLNKVHGTTIVALALDWEYNFSR
ncbi:hypothetical protein SSX86_016342 [Deinandra increscens subsp. villosa]|uniref:Uncharacterized protein n=1 Tax=Deinandra increscens subsp. villosa TaxID=3103831 RepID=A0AAP0D554_9ASTR